MKLKVTKKGFYYPAFIAVWCCLLFSSIPAAGMDGKAQIVVGAHLSLTGAFSQIGAEQRWAYEKAVADINQKGGIFVAEFGRKLPVKLIVIDDKSSPGAVVNAMQKLIKNYSVDFILSGHTAVHGVIPGSIVAEINKVYYHASGSFIEPWKEHKFQWSTLLFLDMKQLASIPFELWNSLVEKKRPKRVAMLMEDTYDALAFGKNVQNRADENGYQIVLDDHLPTGSEHYFSFIEKIKSQQVDAVLLYASVDDSITFIRELRRANIALKCLFGWKGTWSTEFGEVLGDDAQYVGTDGHWSEDYPFTGAKQLGQSYREKFHFPSVSVGAFYASAQVLWQAIEQAGTLNPLSVRYAVLNGSFETVLGRIEYDQQGISIYPAIAFQWIDGKQKMIYPLDKAKVKIKTPFSVHRKE